MAACLALRDCPWSRIDPSGTSPGTGASCGTCVVVAARGLSRLVHWSCTGALEPCPGRCPRPCRSDPGEPHLTRPNLRKPLQNRGFGRHHDPRVGGSSPSSGIMKALRMRAFVVRTRGDAGAVSPSPAFRYSRGIRLRRIPRACSSAYSPISQARHPCGQSLPTLHPCQQSLAALGVQPTA